MYYTIKQVLDDPETRGTLLVPLGIVLLIYPLSVLAQLYGLPGTVFGLASTLLGLYVLARGLGLEDVVDRTTDRVRESLYGGRVTLITYVVAGALLVLGGLSGAGALGTFQSRTDADLGGIRVLAALVYGAVQWFAAAGVTTSLGQITDEYLDDAFEWRYMNAPFYVVAIAAVLHAVSAFILEVPGRGLGYVVMALTFGTLLALTSTLLFALAEDRFSGGPEPA
jgi:putative membrane protein